MRQLPPTAPLRRQTVAPVQATAKAAAVQEPSRALRELGQDELRQVAGGAPKKRW